ncbi:MAG: dual OB domain-containing protein [Flammeovirgaceae bacterium]
MITQFICLANSKKYNERCIAGVIVIQNKKGNHSILKEHDKHQWIRSVTAESNGQVPSNLVGHINLLDIDIR